MKLKENPFPNDNDMIYSCISKPNSKGFHCSGFEISNILMSTGYYILILDTRYHMFSTPKGYHKNFDSEC